MKLTGAQILWESLVREGVTDVFGYPGGAILPAYDAMLDYPIRHVLVRHEQGATHMADGYARASGRVGVAMATSGPGATNMVTGIATAMLDSSPIVCITGQVGSRLIGTDAFQEIDITGITLPITKHNYLVTRADDIARAVREAFVHRASRAARDRCWSTSPRTRSRRRASSTGTPRRRSYPVAPRAGRRPMPRCRKPRAAHQRGRAAGDLRRPRRDDLRRDGGAARRSPRRSHIPVAMTLLGIGGFPASHPLNLGMMGMHGEAWVNQAIQEADLLIALGMRFDDRVTGNLRDLRAQRQEDSHRDRPVRDQQERARSDVPLVGDLRDVLDAPDARRSQPRDRTRLAAPDQRPQGRLRGARHPVAARRRPPLRARTSSTISGAPPATATTIVVTDVGQHQMWEAQYYHHDGRAR